MVLNDWFWRTDAWAQKEEIEESTETPKEQELTIIDELPVKLTGKQWKYLKKKAAERKSKEEKE